MVQQWLCLISPLIGVHQLVFNNRNQLVQSMMKKLEARQIKFIHNSFRVVGYLTMIMKIKQKWMIV